MSNDDLQGREVIFEFTQIGHIVKVTAMDVKSKTEIVMQGPTTVPQKMLEKNALKKLEYVLSKNGLL
ncbi:MAG: hypothetical protein CMH30_08115 [Micavibrio sp.]|nr:hypothetical protein [Micavibrio sp.]|tara:strand:+ start:2027 stop:2227 length:201 start_codon:yes stop_codon:yes gene_type:complete